MSRNTLATLGIAVLLAIASPLAAFDDIPTTPPPGDENMVTHGPILGRLSADGVGIWARTQRPGVFAVRYGVDPDLLDEISQSVETSLEHDNTGWVHLQELQPDTRYYYELQIVESRGRSGRKGTFRTLPFGPALVDEEWNPDGLYNFSFEFACGNNQNPWHSSGPELPTFRTMLREIGDEVDFAILNGDWLYETQREYTPQQWAGQVGISQEDIPYVLQAAPTLTGVWENYKHFLSQGQSLSEWHRNVPSFFTFDDHEILNDVWGAGTPGMRDRRAVFRDIGVRAWYDYLGWSNPSEFMSQVHLSRGVVEAGSDILVDESVDFTQLNLEDFNNLHIHWGTPTAGVNDNSLDLVDGDPNAGVYGIVEVVSPHEMRITPAATTDGNVGYSIGRRSYYRMQVANCDFFFLDTRSEREMHDTREPNKDISMLGLPQREWLLNGLAESEAEFVFLVSSVNFMVPHVGGGAIREGDKDEAWTVFLRERELLIETCDAMTQPVFVLTGDLHNSFAIQITDNVFELASGPHNSNNHWASDEGGRPANGPYQYGPRPCDILWSTWFSDDVPRQHLTHVSYCVVQVNNVFNNPQVFGQNYAADETRWVAYPRPHVIIRYYDGRTGELRFAHSVQAGE